MFLKTFVALAAITIACYSAWTYWQRYTATHNAHASISNEVLSVSVDVPDETPVADLCDQYQTEEDYPRKIFIDSLGINMCIEQVALDRNGYITAPSNIHLGGYYIKSARPGEKGATVINGHMLGRYNKAAFQHLDDVKLGAEIHLQLGNKSWLTYEVVDKKTYAADKVMGHIFQPIDFDNDEVVKNQLTLVPSVGAADATNEAYDTRTIVYARLN